MQGWFVLEVLRSFIPRCDRANASLINPSLAKAEPISEGCSVSGITYLRKDRKPHTPNRRAAAGERNETM